MSYDLCVGNFISQIQRSTNYVLRYRGVTHQSDTFGYWLTANRELSVFQNRSLMFKLKLKYRFEFFETRLLTFGGL